jgi:hypothetical protein
LALFYYYKHPETGEIFSDQRMEGFEEKPFIHKGVECELMPDYIPPSREQKNELGIINKNAECFEKDPYWVKKCKPKYIKFKDGHREKYDPTRHF